MWHIPKGLLCSALGLSLLACGSGGSGNTVNTENTA